MLIPRGGFDGVGTRGEGAAEVTRQADGKGVGVVVGLAAEVEEAGGTGGGEHVLQRGQSGVEVAFGGAAGGGGGGGGDRGHGPGATVFGDFFRPLVEAGGAGHGTAPFALATGVAGARLDLGELLVELVHGLFDVRNVVGQLAFRSVVPKQLDFAVGDLGRVCSGCGVRLDDVGLGAQTDGDALDAFGMAEIGGEKVEADGNETLGVVAGGITSGRPDDAEAIQGRTLDADAGVAGVVGESGRDIFHGLQATAALVGFIGAATLFPQLPALGGFRTLLFVFKGHADRGAIGGGCGLRGAGVGDGEGVGLALVQVGDGDVAGLLDHGGGGVDGAGESKGVMGRVHDVGRGIQVEGGVSESMGGQGGVGEAMGGKGGLLWHVEQTEGVKGVGMSDDVGQRQGEGSGEGVGVEVCGEEVELLVVGVQDGGGGPKVILVMVVVVVIIGESVVVGVVFGERVGLFDVGESRDVGNVGQSGIDEATGETGKMGLEVAVEVVAGFPRRFAGRVRIFRTAPPRRLVAPPQSPPQLITFDFWTYRLRNMASAFTAHTHAHSHSLSLAHVECRRWRGGEERRRRREDGEGEEREREEDEEEEKVQPQRNGRASHTDFIRDRQSPRTSSSLVPRRRTPYSRVLPRTPPIQEMIQ